MALLERDMTEARRLIADALPTVRFGQARLDVLDHTAARFQYAARRELVMEDLARGSASEGARLSPAEQRLRITSIIALRDSSLNLVDRYEELWRRDNRYPMLDPLLARLRKQTTALDMLLRQARTGTLVPEQPPRTAASTPIQVSRTDARPTVAR